MLKFSHGSPSTNKDHGAIAIRVEDFADSVCEISLGACRFPKGRQSTQDDGVLVLRRGDLQPQHAASVRRQEPGRQGAAEHRTDRERARGARPPRWGNASLPGFANGLTAKRQSISVKR